MTGLNRSTLAVAAAVLIAALIAYANTRSAPFVFDDRAAILDNPTLRGSLAEALSPPAGGQSVSGRPLVNLSFALNHRIGGTNPAGYRFVNVLLHALAGLVLFGIVRRSSAGCRARLRRRSIQEASPEIAEGAEHRKPEPIAGSAASAISCEGSASDQRDAAGFAFAVALLWVLHPLQTAAVTYVVQRAEVMAGLFYLLTLYAFIRGATGVAGAETVSVGAQLAAPSTAPREGGASCAPAGTRAPARGWWMVSFVCCALGMATKETLVTAPLLVLLYDRTFVAGSFRAAWSARWRYYLALASTWLLLAWLMFGTGGRGGTVGYTSGVTAWHYLLTQCEAIVRYLGLAVWPHPLVFDYGEHLVTTLDEVWPQALFLAGLLGGTLVALWRWPRRAFLPAAFFLVLAPTSSIVPIASQTIAEHRLYLALAACVVALGIALRRALGRGAGPVLLLAALVAGGLTFLRNQTYRSEIELWRDTARHAPHNARAHANLGAALLDAGRAEEAATAFERALQLQPDAAELHLNLAHAYTRAARPADAVTHGEAAVRLNPESADAHLNLAAALLQLGRLEEAARHQAEAHRLRPGSAELDRLRADTHLEQLRRFARDGAWASAREQLASARSLAPDYAEVHFAAGNLAAAANDFAGAIAAYRRTIELDPEHVRARNNLANALLVSGQTTEAIEQYREVLRRRPGDASVEQNLRQAEAMATQRPAPSR